VELQQLQTLYGGPPSDFVAARDALAKELRGAGDRDAAAAVKRLRKHSPVEWTLNRVAKVHPDVVAAFATAAEDLRTSQAAAIEGRRGGDVRDAMTQLRARSADVVAAAADVDRSVPAADVTGLLRELAADEGATRQLTEGILGSGDLGDHDPFAGLTPATRPSTPPHEKAETATSTKATKESATKAEKATNASATKAEKTAAAVGRRGASPEQPDRRAERDEARRAREESAKRRADLRQAERDARQAAERQADARAAVDDAERQLAAARRQLTRATAERTAADEVVERLRS
jgi:hypothetical protein